MWVRISAAVAVFVLAGILFLVGRDSFAPDPVVIPTGGVTDRGPQDDLPAGSAAWQELLGRTELQRWRSGNGESIGTQEESALRADPAAEERKPAAGDAAERVNSWLAARRGDWAILQTPSFLSGTVNLPKDRGGVLVQPQGREWRQAHNSTLPDAGGWIIVGSGLILALFLLARGRIPLEVGFSGRPVLRFALLERANHWMAAISFIIMALTGLIILYGRELIRPWAGAEVFSDIAAASLFLHVAFAFPFVIGILLMAVFWLRQNLPEPIDFVWLGRLGGFLSSNPVKPAARRFNAGQKLVFWSVIIGGVLLFISGLSLLFPLFLTNVVGMQWAMMIHTALAVLMIALIIGHIYIGTIGMVGAFDAMWTGQVDRNWAEEHHQLWLAEMEGRSPEELEREIAHKAQLAGRPSAAE